MRANARRQRGATLVEYGFILALIVIVVMAVVVTVGSKTSALYELAISAF